jgi:hypothetical protein
MRAELDATAIARLRTVLTFAVRGECLRERYSFSSVMKRWEALVCPAEPEQSGDDLDELIDEFVIPGWSGRDPPEKRLKLRRPRVDHERYAALLLGVIFHEYTGKAPKRWTTISGETSPFYRFARDAFRAVGLYPRVQAFRWVGTQWDRSRGFSKGRMERLLWGDLVPGPSRLKRHKSPRKTGNNQPLQKVRCI